MGVKKLLLFGLILVLMVAVEQASSRRKWRTLTNRVKMDDAGPEKTDGGLDHRLKRNHKKGHVTVNGSSSGGATGSAGNTTTDLDDTNSTLNNDDREKRNKVGTLIGIMIDDKDKDDVVDGRNCSNKTTIPTDGSGHLVLASMTHVDVVGTGGNSNSTEESGKGGEMASQVKESEKEKQPAVAGRGFLGGAEPEPQEPEPRVGSHENPGETSSDKPEGDEKPSGRGFKGHFGTKQEETDSDESTTEESNGKDEGKPAPRTFVGNVHPEPAKTDGGKVTETTSEKSSGKEEVKPAPRTFVGEPGKTGSDKAAAESTSQKPSGEERDDPSFRVLAAAFYPEPQHGHGDEVSTTEGLAVTGAAMGRGMVGVVHTEPTQDDSDEGSTTEEPSVTKAARGRGMVGVVHPEPTQDDSDEGSTTEEPSVTEAARGRGRGMVGVVHPGGTTEGEGKGKSTSQKPELKDDDQPSFRAFGGGMHPHPQPMEIEDSESTTEKQSGKDNDQQSSRALAMGFHPQPPMEEDSTDDSTTEAAAKAVTAQGRAMVGNFQGQATTGAVSTTQKPRLDNDIPSSRALDGGLPLEPHHTESDDDKSTTGKPSEGGDDQPSFRGMGGKFNPEPVKTDDDDDEPTTEESDTQPPPASKGSKPFGRGMGDPSDETIQNSHANEREQEVDTAIEVKFPPTIIEEGKACSQNGTDPSGCPSLDQFLKGSHHFWTNLKNATGWLEGLELAEETVARSVHALEICLDKLGKDIIQYYKRTEFSHVRKRQGTTLTKS